VLSGVLQIVASVERWVVARADLPAGDVTFEDHLYDYFWPADPWVPIGTAAQVVGLALLLVAAAVGVLALSLRRTGTAWALIAVGGVAVPIAVTGMHALASGAIGAPTFLQHGAVQAIAWAVPFLGLLALAVRWIARAPFLALAAVLLLGVTLPGYLVATFAIAPRLVGYQSHDTTPWSETVVAVCTLLAGVSLAAAAARNEPARASGGAARS
jgi:hypothetical protein